MVGTNSYKWHVHCPVCGAFLEKSSQSDSELDCKKCKSTLEVLVKKDVVSVRPVMIKDEQLKARIQMYDQKVKSVSERENRIM